MAAFKRLINLMDKIITYVALVAFGVMAILIILQVIFRYIIGSSLSFSEELARFLFVWSTMLGSAMCLKRRAHIGFDLLMTYMPNTVKKYGNLISGLIALAFYLTLVIYGFQVVGLTMGQVSPAMGLKMGFIYLSIPVAGMIMLLDGVYNIIEDFGIYSKADSTKGAAKT
jgi:TRAP-type C4-dicarboxylate transport system permease small subunit